MFMNNALVGAMPAGSRVDGCVARQQQLDDVDVTIRGGEMQRGLIAKGTGDQEQISEAQYNTKISNVFLSTMQG
jgi:hypothetical protein